MKEELLALIKRYEPRSHYESYTNLYQTGRAEAYQLIIADLRFILSKLEEEEELTDD